MAEAAVEREYRRHERAVQAMLARRHPRLSADERSELYQEAWAGVLAQRARGREIETLEGYLVGAADKLAAKRLYGADARRRTTFDPLEAPLAWVTDEADSPEQRLVADEDARLLRMLVEELDERERAVLGLRLDAGLEPAEIRARLGLSARQYRRVAERAGRALLSQLDDYDRGLWARRQRSLLSACVLGIASPRQRARARRLVAADPLCRALLAELRTAGGRIAALLPAPVAVEARPAGRLAELAQAVKQTAVGLSSRAIEATPLAGARPGAAAAVVAGCLAAGGGAICAVEGVPDGLPALGKDRPEKAERPAAKRREPPPPAAQPPPAPAARPAASAPPPAQPPRAAPAPAPAREFEPVAPRAAPAPPPQSWPPGSAEFSP